MTTAIVATILILSVIYIILAKPKFLYYVMVFFAGWYSVFVDVGLTLTAYRLICIIFLLWFPVYLSVRKNIIRLQPSTKYLLVFVYYAIVVTVVAQFFVPESHITVFTRGEGRWIFQIALLLIDITPAFIPLLIFTRIKDIRTTAKVFIVSTTILCILGWMQSLAFYLYGTALFPVFREGLLGNIREVITVNIFGMTFHRMHSLGGEPKGFAVTVAVAIVLLIMTRIVNPKRLLFRNLLVGFFLASLIASLATSGFFVLFMGLALVVILPFFVKELKLKLIFKYFTVIGVAIIIFLGIVISSGVLSPDAIKQVLLERIIGRLAVAATTEPWDAAALSFLFTHPQHSLFGVGMGNIHLYTLEHLVQYILDNPPMLARMIPGIRNIVFATRSGYLRIILELGVIGLILFLHAYLRPIQLNFKYRRNIHNNRIKYIVLVLNLFATFVLVTVLMRYFHMNYAYITLGLVYFVNREIRAVSRRVT